MLSTATSKKTRGVQLQKYTWPFTLLVALGGLWEPKLGLLVLPVMLTLMVLSFFKGRYWCGNICSHGSLFDHVLGRFSRQRKIPQVLKSPWVRWGFFAFFGYNITRRLIKVAALWGTSSFWDRLGFIFVVSYLMVLVVGGTLAVLIKPRTWCSICPMGTMEKLSYQLGKLTRAAERTDTRVTILDAEKCRACGKCSKACPMELTPHLTFSESQQFSSFDCIRCGKCVEACPFSLLTLAKVLPQEGGGAA